VNIHEERAWKLLIELGARELMVRIGLRSRACFPPSTSAKKLCLLVQAVLQVVGNSNANRRHVVRAWHPRARGLGQISANPNVSRTVYKRHLP
jgi:hypothetical protein